MRNKEGISDETFNLPAEAVKNEEITAAGEDQSVEAMDFEEFDNEANYVSRSEEEISDEARELIERRKAELSAEASEAKKAKVGLRVLEFLRVSH